jgi:Holliday junction DNA helicase RuvA
MIGKLQGTVDYIGDDYVILMTPSGVGYKVFIGDKSAISNQQSAISLFIETIVREDSIRLFGFATLAAQDLFNQLTTVSGVGPRVAMAIMGTLKPDVLMTAIATGDAKTIATAPGVGKKVAEKIIVELKSKVGGIAFDKSAISNQQSAITDLLSALETLGYRRGDIVELAQKLTTENPDFGIEKLVPMALKEITKK